MSTPSVHFGDAAERRTTLQRVLREPLLHFLVLGALLFGAYALLNGGASGSPQRIVVDQARTAALAREFQQVWQRPPSGPELQGLVDRWVRDEILYREGLAAGLDREDPVIRRRVAQKLSFLAESMATELPTDAELQTWLDEHAADYRVESSYTLRQVFVDPDRHARDLEATLARIKSTLERRGDAVVGDSTLLPAELDATPASDVERTFGAEFANALATLPVGAWQGPLRSAYGLHFVRIEARSDGRAATLDEARAAVERDVMSARTERATEAFYEAARSRYEVVTEATEPAP